MAVTSSVREDRDLLRDGRMSTFGQAVFVEWSTVPGLGEDLSSCQVNLEEYEDAHVG